MNRILITGAGGMAGVNFTRAVSLESKLELYGTEANDFHTIFANNVKISKIPLATDPRYIDSLNKLITSAEISFVHPQPTPELQKIVQNKDKINAKTYLPEKEVVLKDKFDQQLTLKENGLSVAKSTTISDLNDLVKIENLFQYPVWVRARKGVGGRLSNKCNSLEEIKLWIKLCVIQGRAKIDEFLIQQYFAGRDIAWDSLWYDGKLVASYCRERLEYPFSKLTMSGITGTPSVARIIHDQGINELAVNSIKTLTSKPHGCFSVDVKEDENKKPYITEVDSGKFHTTIGLWGFLAEKNLGLPWYYNIPRLYVHLGLGGELPISDEKDIYPKDVYLIRNLDCGAWMKFKNQRERVI